MGGRARGPGRFALLLILMEVSAHAEVQSDVEDKNQLPTERNEIISNSVSNTELEETSEQTKGKIEFSIAELADAELGSGIASNQKALESLTHNVESEHSGFEVKDARCPDRSGENRESSDSMEIFSTLAHVPSFSQGEERPEKKATNALELTHAESSAVEPSNATGTVKTPKVNCEERNITGLDHFVVQILNSSQDLTEFLSVNGSDCSVVLFYTPWCQFSADLGPHFNALPRAFPSLQFLALDASQHSSLSTRFGTVAVPNILLFQGVKPMARFNHTDRTLSTLKAFIFNQTGLEANGTVELTEKDLSGPLPSVAVRGIDWLLVFSVLFVCAFLIYGTVQSDSIKWLIPGQEHEHQD
ncbi:thioredoxin domain-containing protein 15 [Narcine bancroftii]|uniref:thioredoxin domain-containing protein 15 n=1 Tax=Narcine bancroftii TaxID=1343680 RepID=UPI003831279C